MDRKKIFTTICLTIFEFFLVFYFHLYEIVLIKIEQLFGDGGIFISLLTMTTPVGLVFFLNYYVFSPFISYIIIFLWRYTGHYKYISQELTEIMKKAVEWLISCNCHWGVNSTADQCQNANTCEALVAINKASLARKKVDIYTSAFQDVLSNLTDKGLPSKSLGEATVVCTSMLLYLISIDKKNGLNLTEEADYEKYNNLASDLWNCHSEWGWGVYLSIVGRDKCSLANTNWALRSLNQYDISSTEGYISYVRMVYEYNNDGAFGYFVGDSPRLVTTAMYLSLYYELQDQLR